MTDATSWIGAFPGLADMPPDLVDTLSRSSAVIALSSGTRIYGPGQAPAAFLLLLDGCVRVQQVSESGREIVLYRVAAGESCALTTACLMGHDDYQAEAIAETGIRAVAIPRGTFDDLVARSPEFRRFVFAAFSARITDLFRLVDEVAFQRMDIRLAHKLIELSHGSASVAATQQQLAAELGTAREVVSRMLSEFHRRGWVSVERGHVNLTNRPAIERLTREH